MKKLLTVACLLLVLPFSALANEGNQEPSDSTAGTKQLEFVGYAYTAYSKKPIFVLYATNGNERSPWLAIGKVWRGYKIAAFEPKTRVLNLRKGESEIALSLRKRKGDLWESPIVTNLSPKRFVTIVETHILNHAESFWKDDTGIDREDLDGRVFLRVYNGRIVWVMGFKSKRRQVPYGQEGFEVMDDSPETLTMDELYYIAWIPGIWNRLGDYVIEAKTRDSPIKTARSPNDVVRLTEEALFNEKRHRSDFEEPDVYLIVRKSRLVWLVGFRLLSGSGLVHDDWTLIAELDDAGANLKIDIVTD
jgi:hypothetical protein